MNQFLVNMIYSLCGATFVSFIFEALMLDGKIKKYSGIAVSIVVISIMAMPIVNLVSSHDIFDISMDMGNVEYDQVTSEDYKNFLSEVYQRNQ